MLKLLIGPYVHFGEGVRNVETEGMEYLYNSIKAHEKGGRLFVLFRHVAKEDAMVILKTLTTELSSWCRKNGKDPVDLPVHILYGKDVLNWSGRIARWGVPKIGGIPVINGRFYRPSLEALKKAVKDGRFPLVFAPESQVTYRMFRVSDLASGFTMFTRWAYGELRKKGSRGKVMLLPVSIGYSYREGAEEILKRNIKFLSSELDCRIREDHLKGDAGKEKVMFLAERLVGKLESLYSVNFSPSGEYESREDIFRARVENLCRGILSGAEASAGIEGSGSILDRVFALRYRIINTIYREDVDPSDLPPLERAHADYRASCASFLKRDEEIVDALEYLDAGYVEENPSVIRLAEFSMIMRDVVNRMYGGNINSRYSPGGKTACLVFGYPVEITPEDPFPGPDTVKEEVRNGLYAVSVRLENIMEDMENRKIRKKKTSPQY